MILTNTHKYDDLQRRMEEKFFPRMETVSLCHTLLSYSPSCPYVGVWSYLPFFRDDSFDIVDLNHQYEGAVNVISNRWLFTQTTSLFPRGIGVKLQVSGLGKVDYPLVVDPGCLSVQRKWSHTLHCSVNVQQINKYPCPIKTNLNE